ncbi:MAG: SGNH/GDSL hydrolase family protein [Rhodoglobus sp.]
MRKPRFTAAVGIILVLAIPAVMTVIAPTVDSVRATESPRHERGIDVPQADVSFAAVGDSMTAWVDEAGVSRGDRSWVNHIPAKHLHLVGGWAQGGAQTSLMMQNVTPVDADVLVIMAGTNDLGDQWGVPMQERLDHILAIAQTVGARHVVLSAIPPLDLAPQWSTEYNAVLQQFAATMGWSWVDPWVQLRAPDGHYINGLTPDGAHPTPAGFETVAQVLASAIRAASR